jgi:serine palmitoyltransferase
MTLCVQSAELLDIPGLEISSHVLSPIVFLKLKKSTGSSATDLDLLETIVERVSSSKLQEYFQLLSSWTFHKHIPISFLHQMLKEDSVFIVTSKKSNLDRCKLPVGIRLFVSAGHTESDISTLSSSLKRVSASVLSDYIWSVLDSLQMKSILVDTRVHFRPCVW